MMRYSVNAPRKTRTRTYLSRGDTAMATLAGKVQGVVVQTSKYSLVLLLTRNLTYKDGSVTSLYESLTS